MATTAVAPAPEAAPQPGQRSPVRSILGIWIVMTIALELFSIFVPAHLMGVAAAKTMVDIENAVTVFSVAAAPVAALVWSIALYSLLRWRHRGDGPPQQDGPPLRGNLVVQTTWILVSSFLCLFLFIWGLIAMQTTSASASSGNATVVDVTGQQWLWTFTYPNAHGYTANELYLPVNRPVTFDVTSEDVVHSFWLVEMGIKIDANPGEITTISVTPDKVGTYIVRCAELCGIYHTYMDARVHVLSDADYQKWLTAHSGAQG
jgi:cytochrome c oxidase subunit 2